LTVILVINNTSVIGNQFKIQSLKMNGLSWYNYLQLKSKTYMDDDITINYIKLLKECAFFLEYKCRTYYIFTNIHYCCHQQLAL